MRKLLLVALALGVIALGYHGFGEIQESREIGPARDAVLAMQTDTNAPASQTGQVTLPESPPNIVIIVADDLGWRDVGYNFSEIRTPNIDRLAAAGLTLNRFYVHPSCSPTRAALMTGKSPMRLGILNPLSKNNPTGLPIEEPTLADYLKAVGYQTALTGKWHLGPRNLAYHPNNRGFDHFYGHLTGGVGYYDKVHGGGYDWQRNGKTVRNGRYSTHLVADEAVRFINARDSEGPFFLYAAFGAPHLPNEAPEASIESYKSIADTNRRIHAAMVSELDSAIGRIHDALIAQGIEQETLIWFMSDNGGLYPYNPARYLPDPLFSWAAASMLGVEMTPEFASFLRTNLNDGGADNRPFASGKQSVQEGGVRVPSFIYWPGQIEADAYNFMATVQDIVPTLLEITGGSAIGTAFDGRSLWPSLQSNTAPAPKEYIVATRVSSEADAVYLYPYKLIEQGGDQRLYDLENDPLETTDIAAREPDIVADLSDYLATFPRGKNVAVPLQQVVNDPDFFGGEEDRKPWAEQAYASE
ncbi:arylsulfatase B [Alterisphingorhabdus coralli]|uniref:Arylsulfatase n=1 Tax=Alterisphingorhabdus coralli TaxID=3071408 RepID=A0AA97F9I9_9SPHN|nr:arylsulfatase [Parasphingorhabdus sp. SCSIO 66989]WOE75537.1 arylsulfatase [Parasphingorhabdus sp. SCSIO 66989]